MAPDSPQMFGVALMAMWGTAGAVALGRSMAKSPAARELAAAVRKMNLAAKGALVAGLVCAVAIGGTKPGGTNDPPRGLRSPPATVAVEPSFAPVEVRTNNVALRAESASAVEVEDWRKHGSSSGGVWLDFDEPLFRIGTNPVFRAHVAANGAVSFDSMRRPPVGAPLPDGTGLPALAPLLAPLGMVPEANWTSAGAASRFWHDAAPGRGRVFTWEEALLDRLPGRRVSVQTELLPSGDFTYRYDFSDALDPPATNLVIGAQVGTNGVNALAILGTNTLAATVWRVDGACVANGVSIADLLCTNGVLRTPARFAIEWKNTTGIDPNADTDGDGLSDWDEVFRHGTDPNQADTDGDGLSDSAEVLAGANPLNADENNDGVPDGVTSADWTADPLWGETAGETNLVITLVSDIPPGETATLTLGTLALPLRQARAYPLCLRPGQTIPFHLFSTCSGVVPLRIETGEEPMRSRGALRSPPVIVSPFSPAPIWVEDRERVFAPAARDGSGRIAHPVLKLVDETGRDNDVDVCLHGGATSAEWTVSILPADIGLTVDDLDLYEFTKTSDDKIALSIGSGASMLDSQSGSAMLAPPVLYAGEITEWRSIHRCRGFWSTPVCHVCGFPHGPNYACSHEPDCAAVLDRNAACTCGHVYVHVAWQDADGNGTEDLNDAHLVPDAGNYRFRGLGRGDDGCCCWELHDEYPMTLKLVSHSTNLRVFDAAGGLMSPNSTSSVFTVQAKAPSPRVKGSEVVYELLGPTNDTLRRITVPVTAWDLFDTGLSYNWATNAHAVDAINLRRDYSTPIDYMQPEWVKGANHTASLTRDEPACWIAGTSPTVRARFEIRPSDITNATLTADFDGTILSWIDETAVTFSNGVTRSIVGTNAVPFAPFSLASDITNVVSRSTNEVWHWYASSVNNHPFDENVSVATNGPSVAYSILGEPVAPWTDSSITNQNAWISVLDFLTPTNVCGNATNKTNALARLTQFLFEGHHLRYDRYLGDCKYFHFPDPSMPGSHHWFDVSGYMVRNKGNVVNCYDQAYAVSLFGKLAGIESDVVFLQPFGFINETRLVGIGRCNSPFYTSGPLATETIRGSNDTARAWFLNHRYVIRDDKIFDACAGPALGTQTHQQYLDHSVDTSTTDERDLTDFQSDYRVNGKKAGDIGNKEIDAFLVEIQ